MREGPCEIPWGWQTPSSSTSAVTRDTIDNVWEGWYNPEKTLNIPWEVIWLRRAAKSLSSAAAMRPSHCTHTETKIRAGIWALAPAETNVSQNPFKGCMTRPQTDSRSCYIVSRLLLQEQTGKRTVFPMRHPGPSLGHVCSSEIKEFKCPLRIKGEVLWICSLGKWSCANLITYEVFSISL